MCLAYSDSSRFAPNADATRPARRGATCTRCFRPARCGDRGDCAAPCRSTASQRVRRQQRGTRWVRDLLRGSPYPGRRCGWSYMFGSRRCLSRGSGSSGDDTPHAHGRAPTPPRPGPHVRRVRNVGRGRAGVVVDRGEADRAYVYGAPGAVVPLEKDEQPAGEQGVGADHAQRPTATRARATATPRGSSAIEGSPQGSVSSSTYHAS